MALVQTFAPENEVIAQAAAQDYRAFYDSEIKARRLMGYPPYTDLFLFGFAGVAENDVKKAAGKTVSFLRYYVQKKYPDVKLIVLDPTPAAVAKMSGKFRYKLLVKSVNTRQTRALIQDVLDAYQHEPVSKFVSIYVDVNPSAIL